MNEMSAQFWNLVEPEHLKVRAFCRKLSGDRHDGDDLYQDALVSALTGFGSLKNEEAFRSWLYRIVINRYKNRYRRPFWKRFVPLTNEISESVAGKNEAVLHGARRRLEIAFGAISPEEKGLITLFELQGWSISELALMTDKTEGNVKVKLSRIRKKMREALSRYLNEPSQRELRKLLTSEDEICVVTKPEKR